MTQHPMNKARYYDINNRIHYTTRCQTITSDNEIRDDKIRSDRTVVQESMLDVKVCKIYNNMEDNNITAELFNANEEFNKLDKMYDECLSYLKDAKEVNGKYKPIIQEDNNNLENIKDENLNGIRKDLNSDVIIINMSDIPEDPVINCIVNKNGSESEFPILENVIIEDDDNENKSKKESIDYEGPTKSERLRRLSEQLPRIIITQSNTSLDVESEKPKKKPTSEEHIPIFDVNKNHVSGKVNKSASTSRSSSYRYRSPYIDYPKRMVSKLGVENVALISNVPYGKLRLLNDTFHTLINLRWRWIVTGTVVVHFAIWLVFAVFWYLASLAHYDFDPDPPLKACVTGGKDFVTIFLASVEAQTTIGFGDRTIDEECPESIFLFIMQLILGTGLSGVLTCVVYAKLTRPEKLSRDGVGFSKKAVVCMRDGKLCLMLRAWDLNYDHLISSDFNAHFVKTKRTKEGEYIRYYASSLELQQSQFLLWPVTIVHIIDENSPLFNMTPENFMNSNYEITVSLKGASASMGTFTQSQTSYLPREVLWGYRFPSVVKYNHRKRKYVIDYKKLDLIEQIDTPLCSASQLYSSILEENEDSTPPWAPGTPSSFSDKISSFKQERTSSFRRKHH